MLYRSSYALAVVSLLIAACDRPPAVIPPPDGGRDAGAELLDAGPMGDGGTPTDGGPMADGGMPSDGGPRPDGGMIMPGDSVPTDPPTVTRAGSGGVLLIGIALTPSGPLDGEVLVVGDTITCVAASCRAEPMADAVTVIDTHGGIISPGMINAHDHLSYDFLPEWVPEPARLFPSRYVWRSDAQYRDHVSPENATGAVCAGSLWGELRSIMHGTTTVQGQSPAAGLGCMQRLARNADHQHFLGPDRARATISGPCESGFTSRTSLINDFEDGSTTRFYVHVGEGFMPGGVAGSSTDPTREFDCYAGRTGPTPSLLLDASGVPYETAVMIHGVPLTVAQLDEALTANARFVWSPSSNIVLYDHTAPIAEMLSRGLTVALAPDWTVSGSDEMLSELRFAREYGTTTGIEALTTRRLFEMATSDAAEVTGLQASVGTVAPGMRADLAVYGRTAADPYQAVIDSRARDVRLTLIDGVAYYGDLALEASTAVNGLCDNVDVCGIPRFLCVRDTPPAAFAETVESIEATLLGILEPLGRGADLLPLADCSL